MRNINKKKNEICACHWRQTDRIWLFISPSNQCSWRKKNASRKFRLFWL